MVTYSKKELEVQLQEANRKLKAYQDLISDDINSRKGKTFSRKFKGTLAIIDAVNMLTDEDWEDTGYGTNLIELGIYDYIPLNVPEGDKIVIKNEKGDLVKCYYPEVSPVLITTLEQIKEANKYMSMWVDASDCCIKSFPNFDGEVQVTNTFSREGTKVTATTTGSHSILIETFDPESSYIYGA